MWNRIQYAEWADIVPYLAFFFTFGVFLVMAVRALCLRRDQTKRLASLPLEEDHSEHSTDQGIESP